MIEVAVTYCCQAPIEFLNGADRWFLCCKIVEEKDYYKVNMTKEETEFFRFD